MALNFYTRELLSSAESFFCLFVAFAQNPIITSRANYGKVQFSEWAPVTNGHLQSKRYQNTVQVKWNLGRRWQLVICGDKFMNFFIISLKTGVNADFSPKYMIVFYQDKTTF